MIMLQAFNVLRYEIGQRYDSHYDAFNPAEYGPQKSQRVHPNQPYLPTFHLLWFLLSFRLIEQIEVW